MDLNEWDLGIRQRHRLGEHLRGVVCSVPLIVLQERDHVGGGREQTLSGWKDVVHLLRADLHHVITLSARLHSPSYWGGTSLPPFVLVRERDNRVRRLLRSDVLNLLRLRVVRRS